MRDRRRRRRQGDAAVCMFEQGRYWRYSVAARVTDADRGDRWRRTLKTRRRDDGGLAGESAGANAVVVSREASADGGTGGSGRIEFLGGFTLLFRLVGIAPDAGEEEEELAVWWVMEERMLTQESRVGRVISWERRHVHARARGGRDGDGEKRVRKTHDRVG